MRTPTVIVDVSTVVRDDEDPGWHRMDALIDLWRKEMDEKATFYGVLDHKSWYLLDDAGQAAFAAWQAAGRGTRVRWADPLICETAEKYPHAKVLTRDLYRDLPSGLRLAPEQRSLLQLRLHRRRGLLEALGNGNGPGRGRFAVRRSSDAEAEKSRHAGGTPNPPPGMGLYQPWTVRAAPRRRSTHSPTTGTAGPTVLNVVTSCATSARPHRRASSRC